MLGTLLAAPSLMAPFAVDDFFHIASLEGVGPAPLDWWELYTFAPLDAARRQMLIQSGALPWWSSPDLTLAFFRPLSSGLIALDHSLFGRNPTGWHLHALLWWVALLVTAGLLYRRLLPAATASLAMLLFAIDDAHWLPVTWSAARNGVVATVPALLVLAAHVRWREHGWTKGSVLSLLGFAVGLMGGEAALAMLGYVIAFELVGRPRETLRTRLVALAPHLALLILYAAVRSASGAGVSGSSLYVDPIREPLHFARVALGRVPALAGNLVLSVPADLWGAVPWTRPWLVTAGVGSLAGLGLWLRSALRNAEANEARQVRWLAVGAFLALVPGAAGMLGERLLLPSTFGAAPVFALLLRDGVRQWRITVGRRRPGRLPIAMAMLAIALPNLVLAGPLFIGKTVLWKVLADNMRAEVCGGDLDTSTHVIVVWSKDPPGAVLGRAIRWFYGKGRTASWTPLSFAPGPAILARTSANELTLSAFGKPLLGSEWDVLFRSTDRPMKVADTVTLQNGLRIVVEAVDDGLPTRVSFHFPSASQSSQFRFLVWQAGRLVPLVLPPIGGQVAVGGATSTRI